jgi:hypothetical protein
MVQVARGTCAIRLTPTHAVSGGRLRCRCRGRPSPNDQWWVHRWRPRVTGLAQASSLLGRPVKDCSASRFRQPSHRAPAGGVRCDRGSPPAPRHFHATRGRAPPRCGNAERHPALAPASPADRRRARDSREARRMDALALAINGNWKHPRSLEPWGRLCVAPVSSLGCAPGGCERLGQVPAHASTRCQAPPLPHAHACSPRRPLRSFGRATSRRASMRGHPGRSNIAAPPCPAMPSRHVCPTRPNAIAKRDG